MIQIIHNHGIKSQLYLKLGLPAVGDADAPLDGERVPLVAAGARLRPLALGARVRAVAALPTGVGKRTLCMCVEISGFRLLMVMETTIPRLRYYSGKMICTVGFCK